MNGLLRTIVRLSQGSGFVSVALRLHAEEGCQCSFLFGLSFFEPVDDRVAHVQMSRGLELVKRVLRDDEPKHQSGRIGFLVKDDEQRDVFGQVFASPRHVQIQLFRSVCHDLADPSIGDDDLFDSRDPELLNRICIRAPRTQPSRRVFRGDL